MTACLSAKCVTFAEGSARCASPEGNAAAPTPLKAIRADCLWCCCGSANEVKLCPATECALHEWRLGHRPPEPAKLTTLPAIRARCIDCLGGSQKAPRNCQENDCSLHEYRLGHRPAKTAQKRVQGSGNPEELRKAREVLRSAKNKRETAQS